MQLQYIHNEAHYEMISPGTYTILATDIYRTATMKSFLLHADKEKLLEKAIKTNLHRKT